jgi:hypothetical protein
VFYGLIKKAFGCYQIYRHQFRRLTPSSISEWTEEVLIISKVQRSERTDPPTHKITDYNGEEIHGTFYEQELQKLSRKFSG